VAAVAAHAQQTRPDVFNRAMEIYAASDPRESARRSGRCPDRKITRAKGAGLRSMTGVALASCGEH